MRRWRRERRPPLIYAGVYDDYPSLSLSLVFATGRVDALCLLSVDVEPVQVVRSLVHKDFENGYVLWACF